MGECFRSPKCPKLDCFGIEEGHCVVLTRNDFKKDCPFYKTKEQVAEEKEYCRNRMAEIKKVEGRLC